VNPYLRFFSIRCNGIALAFAHVRIVADTLAEGAGDDTIRLASAESSGSQRSPWRCAQAGAASPAGFTARSVARILGHHAELAFGVLSHGLPLWSLAR